MNEACADEMNLHRLPLPWFIQYGPVSLQEMAGIRHPQECTLQKHHFSLHCGLGYSSCGVPMRSTRCNTSSIVSSQGVC